MSTTIDLEVSPFTPNSPVEHEFFVGRSLQIQQIESRGLKPLVAGKSSALFIEGEPGSGKTSLARYIIRIAETKYSLPSFIVFFGGEGEDLIRGSVAAASSPGLAVALTKQERLWNTATSFTSREGIAGTGLTLANRSIVLPELRDSDNLFSFLIRVFGRISKDGGQTSGTPAAKRVRNPQGEKDTAETGKPGIVVVFDELEYVSRDREFVHLVKSIIEYNAMYQIMPILLILCGSRQDRMNMKSISDSVGRLFYPIQLNAITQEEAHLFFERSFRASNFVFRREAISELGSRVQGSPWLMQMLGDAVFTKRKFILDRYGNETLVVNKQGVKAGLGQAYDDLKSRHPDQLEVIDTIENEMTRSQWNLLLAIAMQDPLNRAFTVSPAELQRLERNLSGPQKDIDGLSWRELDETLAILSKREVIRKRAKDGFEYDFLHNAVRLYICMRRDPLLSDSGLEESEREDSELANMVSIPALVEE